MNIDDANDDPIEIELIDDSPVEEEIVIEKAEEKSSDPVDSGLEALKEQLEKERQARVEAERRANEAAQNAYYAQNEAQDSNLHLVSNAIETISQTNAILKSNYRDAMAAGDYDTVADIQAEMASNEAKLLQLKQGKQALETQPRGEAPRPYVSDPVEALASQLSPRSANWVRNHPEFATDAVLYGDMIEAHNAATRRGISPDTDDYFSFIERRLDVGNNYEPEPKPVQRRSAPPAAPVSRSGTGTGSRPTRMTLSAEERDMAANMGMTPEEYGRNKLALQKEGKMN